jgi:hypothetical protein
VKAIRYLDTEQCGSILSTKTCITPIQNQTIPGLKYQIKQAQTDEEGIQREAKQIKASEYWLHRTPTSNRHTALLEEDNDQQKVGRNLHQSQLSGVITISPIIPAKKFGFLANNFRAITPKRTEFHTYNPKEEINCVVALKNKHYSINPE